MGGARQIPQALQKEQNQASIKRLKNIPMRHTKGKGRF
jgi:hypothetical protein